MNDDYTFFTPPPFPMVKGWFYYIHTEQGKFARASAFAFDEDLRSIGYEQVSYEIWIEEKQRYGASWTGQMELSKP